MKSFILWSTAAIVLIGLVFIFYDLPIFHDDNENLAPKSGENTQQEPVPIVRYPVPQPEPVEESQESVTDGTGENVQPEPPERTLSIQEMLTEKIGQRKLIALLHLENLIPRFVATIDSLPEKQVSKHHLPVKSPKGKFLVADGSISPKNAERYLPYLELVETLGTEQAVALYVKFYGEFQKAYRDLGYPQGHFNDRFVAVIDHLLETPQVKDPIGVVQPMIVYKYADPALEDLSAGQKLLLRIGEENRKRIVGLLIELRTRLTSLSRSEQAD